MHNLNRPHITHKPYGIGNEYREKFHIKQIKLSNRPDLEIGKHSRSMQTDMEHLTKGNPLASQNSEQRSFDLSLGQLAQLQEQHHDNTYSRQATESRNKLEKN